MSRQDQFMGLNNWALNFLRSQTVKVKRHIVDTYPDGSTKEIDCTTTAFSYKETTDAGTYQGMFDQEYKLSRYTLKDGRIIEEFVQANPWSSGPVFFIALRENGMAIKESLWTQGEINNA